MKGKITVYLISVFILSLISAYFLMYSQNNLAQNNQWIGEKKMLGLGVMGADEFLLSRSVLSKNQLDLSKYWGYQGVKTKKKFDLEKGSFDFIVKEGSFLDFYFGHEGKSLQGVRFNNFSSKKSFFFMANNNYEFLDKKYFEANLLPGWNKVEYFIEKSKLTFLLNGKVVFRVEKGRDVKSPIRLHGGINGAIIDNINIHERDGKTFHESFEFKNNKLFFLFFSHFILIVFLVEVGIRVFDFLKRKKIEKNFEIRVFIVTQSISLLVLVFVFDYCFWSGREDFNQSMFVVTNKKVEVDSLENIRFLFFRRYAQLFGLIRDERAIFRENRYPKDRVWRGPILCSSFLRQCEKIKKDDVKTVKKNKCKRFVFLGTSQTVGAGATSIERSLFSQFYKEYSAEKKECVSSLNLSTSSSNTRDLYEEYKDIIKEFMPHLMIINASNNDDGPSFKESLSFLVNYNKSLNIKTVLLKEPNSIHFQNKNIIEKHKLMDEVGKQYKIPVLPLHSYLADVQKEEAGKLWWDYVHLSDLGQMFAATWLNEEILKLKL